MREILFKGKRIDTGEWIEGNLITDEEITEKAYIGYLFGVRDGIVHDFDVAEVEPSTVCQYTGLEDKDGNKIWEHDLLEYSYDYPGSVWLAQKGQTDDDIKYYVGEVFFSDWRGTWAVCGWGRNRSLNQDVFKYSRNPNRTKVIGNVFDNPELLEGESA